MQALQSAEIYVESDVSARKLSTFAAGGMVQRLVLPADVRQLQCAMRIMRPVRYHVLGGGSNSLVSDFGLAWVLSTKRLKGITVSGDRLVAAAGETLPALAKAACAEGLGGVEFAAGIPGTVGGALKMNAGAYGETMADTVEYATVVTADEVRQVPKNELHLRYRSSQIGGVVAEVGFVLPPKDRGAIEATIRDMQTARAAAQPHQASLGCVFKAAGGVAAAKLIQGCGLKGTRIGGAQVSGVHCNFIVNMGGATARDYLRLVDVVKKAVYERYGVYLEEEFVHLHD